MNNNVSVCEHRTFIVCRGCENCQRRKPHEKCAYIQKYGSYKTKSGETVQRYLCLKHYRYFTKHTDNIKTRYFRKRDIPVDRIIQEYKENVLCTQKSLAKKHDVTLSTIRTILKRDGSDFKTIRQNLRYFSSKKQQIIYCKT